jgi:hypothetical protein
MNPGWAWVGKMRVCAWVGGVEGGGRGEQEVRWGKGVRGEIRVFSPLVCPRFRQAPWGGYLQPCCYPDSSSLIWVYDPCNTCFLFALLLCACTIFLLCSSSFVLYTLVRFLLPGVLCSDIRVSVFAPVQYLHCKGGYFCPLFLAPSTCIGLTRLYFGLHSVSYCAVIVCPRLISTP